VAVFSSQSQGLLGHTVVHEEVPVGGEEVFAVVASCLGNLAVA